MSVNCEWLDKNGNLYITDISDIKLGDGRGCISPSHATYKALSQKTCSQENIRHSFRNKRCNSNKKDACLLLPY